MPGKWWMAALLLVTLVSGCGRDEPVTTSREPDWDRLLAAKTTPSPQPGLPDAQGWGGVKLQLVPEQPTAAGCLRALVEGRPQSAAAHWQVNGNPVTGQEANTLCGNAFRRGDVVTVRVGDQQAGASRSVTIGNAPPRIIEVTVTKGDPDRPGPVAVAAVTEDVDGDPVELQFQWVINGTVDPLLLGDTLPGEGLAKGDRIQVRVTPFDGRQAGQPYESSTHVIPNHSPMIISQPPAQFEAMVYSYQVKAKDPDGDKVTYSLGKAPPGMTVDRATGLVTWPLAGGKPGSYPVKILAADPDGAEAFQEYTLTLGPPAPAGTTKP